jgi:hypothetical protein
VATEAIVFNQLNADNKFLVQISSPCFKTASIHYDASSLFESVLQCHCEDFGCVDL